MLGAGLSPLAAHEAVLQSAAYLGMGRALPFLQALYAEFGSRGLPVPTGGCEPQLTSHAAANLRVGNGAQMLKELVLQMLPYIGYPRALNALACLRKACGN